MHPATATPTSVASALAHAFSIKCLLSRETRQDRLELRSMALLSVRNVTRRFGGIVAIDDVSLDVEQGQIVGLIGPNGAGKTTLFNVITRLYKPDSGELEFDGQEPAAHSAVPDRAAWDRADVPERRAFPHDDRARQRARRCAHADEVVRRRCRTSACTGSARLRRHRATSRTGPSPGFRSAR